jgi:hypothetical protein
MIKTEYLNDGTLIKHYSDKGVLLLQKETGAKYSDPIDIVPCPYTYEETDELIDGDDEEVSGDDSLPEDEIQTKALAYDIIVGEEE